MRAICSFRLLALLFVTACSSGGGSSPGLDTPTTAGVVVTGFSPSSGGVGSMVTIEGAHFGKDPFAVIVRFNGIHGEPGTVQLCTEDRLLVTVPPGSSTGKIAVLAPAGTFLTEEDFTVFPTLISLDPPSPPGAPVGALVEILGFGFDGADPQNNAVSFAGVPATILDGGSTSLIASVPAGAKTGSLIVTTPSGVIVKPYIVQPSITGYSLDYGLPGDPITVSGFNLEGVQSVSFNGTPATVTGASYSSLEVVVPPGFASGPVSVTTPDGVAVGPAFYFPVIPSITGFQPISGIAGQTVTIQGSGFIPGITTVKFAGAPPALANTATTTSLQAVVPSSATTGFLEVAHQFGSGDTQGLTPSYYTALQPPAIFSFSPPFAAWGGSVTIHGGNFDPDPAGNEVRFQGTLATVIQASPTQIVTTVPVGATTGAVTVETDAGTATSPIPFPVAFSRYALVAHPVENTVAVYEMDTVLGQLRYQSFVSTGAGSAPSAVAMNAAGTQAFVTNKGLDSVSVYSLGTNGSLALVQTISTGLIGAEPSGIALHPSESFAYATNRAGSSISVFSVGAGGTLAPVETRGTGREPLNIVFHPSGNFAYCVNSQNSAQGNSITVYAVNPATGGLALLQRKATDSGPRALCMHPSGNWIYCANSIAGTVQVFQIGGDGKLTLSQSPAVSAGSTPGALTADPLFRFLFVANRDSNDISSFAVQSDGSLSPLGGSVFSGTAPSALMADFSDKLYATNAGSDDATVFSISSSGSLQAVSKVASHRGPASIARADAAGPLQIAPRFAFASNTFNPPSPNNGAGERTVVSFQVASNGALSIPSGGVIQTGPDPQSTAADPLGSFLYTANRGAVGTGNGISMFLIGADGLLSANGAVDASTFGSGMRTAFVGIEASGKFLFNTRGNSGATPANVGIYLIDRSPGNFGKLVAAPGSPILMGIPSGGFGFSDPVTAAVHPQGRFFYVYAEDAGYYFLEAFSLDLETGQPSSFGPGGILEFGNGGSNDAVAVHPSGKFLFRVASATRKVFVHPIQNSGAVGAALAQSFDTGMSPRAAAVTPNGKHLFVTNSGGDSVSAYQVDAMTGLLTRIDANPAVAGIQDFPAGDEPFGVTVERSGQFLYVTNSGNCGGPGCVDPNSVSMMRIQPDGSLVPIASSILTGESPKSVATVSTFQ